MLAEDAFLDWLDVHIGGYTALRATGTDLVVVASSCEHHRGAHLDDLPRRRQNRPTSAPA